jgi:hypothetical protein
MSPEHTTSGMSGVGDGGATDRDEQATRKRHLHRHPRRRFTREELGVQLVQFGERVLVAQKDDRVDHQRKAAPAGSKYSVQIGERLPRLIRERVTGRLTGRGINARLPRNEEEPSSADGVGIRADLGR